MGEKRINYSISLLRIVSCLLIVWNHTSAHMLDNAFNKISWSNIGVQIFFFMSGYLYSNKVINNSKKWISTNIKKIMKPYWIYLALIIPVIFLLDKSRLSIIKVVAAVLGIQGLSGVFTIESIGQHWFITYILICYVLTPVFIPKLYKKTEGSIVKIFLLMFLSQIVTMPLAYVCQFKIAYIWVYICGYIYGKRYSEKNQFKNEQQRVERFVYIISIVGLIIRLYIDSLDFGGIMSQVCSLIIQWIKLFQGAAIFIFIINFIPAMRWDTVSIKTRRVIEKLAACTFEIYIVHEFFTCDIFTKYLPFNTCIQIVIVWSAIFIVTVFLVFLEKFATMIIRRKLIE